jgi:hypothetical protein
MLFKVRTGTNVSTAQFVFAGLTSCSCVLYVQSSRFDIALSSASGSWNITEGIKGTYVVLPETDYWLKLAFNGSSYTLSYSLDGVDYINDITKETTSPVYGGVTLGIGVNRVVAEPWLGTIDLTQSYIKINGKYWWSGFYTKSVIGDKHYALIRRYAKHKVGDFNPSTYTVVGSPTITNTGIVSGCTKDKYLIIPKSFPANVTDLEMVWKFNQGGWGGVIVSARESIDGYSNERSFWLACSGYFKAWLSSNGTNGDIANYLHSSVLDYNVWYYGKLTYDGSTYNLYISTDNESWTLCDSVSSTKTLAPTNGNLLIGTNGADPLYNGSIDLSESYIKINGEYWWAGFYTENVYDEKYY